MAILSQSLQLFRFNFLAFSTVWDVRDKELFPRLVFASTQHSPADRESQGKEIWFSKSLNLPEIKRHPDSSGGAAPSLKHPIITAD